MQYQKPTYRPTRPIPFFAPSATPRWSCVQPAKAQKPAHPSTAVPIIHTAGKPCRLNRLDLPRQQQFNSTRRERHGSTTIIHDRHRACSKTSVCPCQPRGISVQKSQQALYSDTAAKAIAEGIIGATGGTDDVGQQVAGSVM